MIRKILLTILLNTFIANTYSQSPSNLNVTNINSNSATISWNSNGCTSTYTIRYRVSGTAWNNLPNINGVSSNSYTLTNLNPNTTYNWRVKCGGSWTNGPTFTTSCNNLQSSYSIINASCNNTLDGSINLTINNGAPPYNFTWSNGSNSQNLIDVGPGIYNVLFTDNNGCTGSDTINIGYNGGVSVSQTFGTFNPNPLLNYNQWSYDTLSITNTGCDVRLRPDFEISSNSGPIQQGDIKIQWINPISGNWTLINYDINSNGNAVGFFNGLAALDSTGTNVLVGQIQEIIVKVKFLNQASYGTYTATMSTNQVDNIGNILSTLGISTSSLTLVNCSNFQIDSISTISTVCGSNTGSAIAHISGGLQPYSYHWSNGSTNTDSIIDLYQGNYYLLANDLNGCEDSINFNINSDGNSDLNLTINSNNILCNGDSTGSAEAIVSSNSNGGTPNGTISLLNYCSSSPTMNSGTSISEVILNGDNSNINNNTSGICDQYEDYTNMYADLTQGQSYTINVSLGDCQNVGYQGGAKVFIDWNIDGDLDDPGEEIGVISYGISSTGTIPITVPNGITNGPTLMRIVCEWDMGANTVPNGLSACNTSSWFGSTEDYTILITSSTPPVSFLWDNGDTTSYINNLQSGTYYCTITDTNNCNSTDSIYISEPNNISSIPLITDVDCNGDTTGSVTLTISGGTPNYTENWGGYNPNALAAGTYIYTITDTNGCIFNDSITIIEPSSIISNIIANNLTCFQDSSGSINLSLSGGTPSYSFLWNNGDTNQNLVGLSAGFYSVNISDNNGCNSIDTISINQPNNISTIPLITDVACNGDTTGSVTLTISGGTPNYTENWGGYNPNTLAAGTYIYTITDNNLCNFTDTISINQPQPLIAFSNSFPTSCFGSNDGSATVNISGGVTNYTLSWDTLNYQLIGGVSIFNTPIGVPYGLYPFAITDLNGCVFNDTILINQPTQISVIENTTNPNCNGFSDGTANLSISGGTPGYIEDWGLINPSSLSAGIHFYSITDTNGCLYSDSVIITEPNAISSNINSTNLTSCLISNGSIDLSVNGGVGHYTYIWNTNDTTQDLFNLSAGNYSVLITDSNGCIDSNNTLLDQPSNGLFFSLTSPQYNGYNINCYNNNNGIINVNAVGGIGPLSYQWSNGDTTSNLINLTAGTYSLNITDSVGCSLEDSITLNEPNEITSIPNTTPVICNGDSNGSAAVTFFGGISDYLLNWNGYSYPLLNGLNTFITPIGVPAGLYPYSLSDANGCIYQDTIFINEPLLINVQDSISNYNGYNVRCSSDSSGSINLSVSGGTTPYTFIWNNNDTNQNLSNISAGIYSVIINDDNGCLYYDTIILNQPTNINLTLTSENVSCYNACDGLISALVSGGVSGYNFSWNNGSNNDSLYNLCQGYYYLTINDNNSCTKSDSIYIFEPNEIQILNDSITDVSVYGGSDGAIYISDNGGIQPITYLWIGPNGFSSTSQDINQIISGDYTITISDSNNCSKSSTFYVSEPSSLSIKIDTVINISCFQECNGKIEITAEGGDSIYTYQWIGPNGFSSTNDDIDSLCAGVYELIVSDTTSSINTTINITQPSALQLIINADTALCFGGTAQATAYTYGGQPPYVTNWNNGVTSISSTLSAGIHYVNVVDDNGCYIYDSVLIIQNEAIQANSINTDVSCYGFNDGIIEINIISGGTPPYIYSINNGISIQNSNIFPNLSIGNHDITITDDNGCEISISDSINEPNEILLNLITSNVSCNGYCDGTAIAVTSGGVGNIIIDWGNLNPNYLCAGLINITAEDSNNCLTTNSAIINEPMPIIVNIFSNGLSLESITGFQSYQWFDANGDTINGANSNIYTPVYMGEYFLKIIDSNGCIGESNKINFIIEYLEESQNYLEIYPNPTNSWVTIQTNLENIELLKIINSNGDVIKEISISENIKNSMKLDMSNFSKGIYIIQLINNENIINDRVIIQ